MAIQSMIPSIFKHQTTNKPAPFMPPHKLSCDSLAKLIRQRKWNDVQTTLKFLKSHYLICSTKCCEKCTSNHGIIHHLCCYQPPLSVIKTIVQSYGDGVLYEQDCLGRYPIRAAVEYEAPFEVVEFLVKMNPAGLLYQDRSGNTPMHIAVNACRNTCYKYISAVTSCKDYYTAIVRLLAREVPMVLNIANNDGITPLQIINELNIDLNQDNVIVSSKRSASLDRYLQKKVKCFLFNYHSPLKRRSIAVSAISI